MILSFNDARFFAKEMSIRDDTAFYRRFTPGTKIQKYFKAQAGGWKSRPKDIDGNPIYKIGEGVVVGNHEIKLEKNMVTVRALIGNIKHNIEDMETCTAYPGPNVTAHEVHKINQQETLEGLAQKDGFKSWAEMKKYFKIDKIGTYKGRLIMWENIDYKPILQRCNFCGKTDEIQLLERLNRYPDFWYHGRCAK